MGMDSSHPSCFRTKHILSEIVTFVGLFINLAIHHNENGEIYPFLGTTLENHHIWFQKPYHLVLTDYTTRFCSAIGKSLDNPFTYNRV